METGAQALSLNVVIQELHLVQVLQLRNLGRNQARNQERSQERNQERSQERERNQTKAEQRLLLNVIMWRCKQFNFIGRITI